MKIGSANKEMDFAGFKQNLQNITILGLMRCSAIAAALALSPLASSKVYSRIESHNSEKQVDRIFKKQRKSHNPGPDAVQRHSSSFGLVPLAALGVLKGVLTILGLMLCSAREYFKNRLKIGFFKDSNKIFESSNMIPMFPKISQFWA